MHIRQLIKIEKFYIVRELLKARKIKDEWLGDLYALLTLPDEDNEITKTKYELIKLILTEKIYFKPELFTSLSNIFDNKIVSELFKAQYKEVYFPIYNVDNEDESILAKALVVPLSSKTFSLNTFVKSESLDTIKIATNQNFFVMFDNQFSGESYKLAVVTGIIAKNKDILENVAFTGNITSDGLIIPVKYLDKKKKIAQKEGKTLITPEDIETIDELHFWLNPEHMPVIFIHSNKPDLASQSLKQIEDAIKKDERFKHFKIENLKKFYQLQDEDMYLITPSVDFSSKEELVNILSMFKEKIKNLLSLKGIIKDQHKVILNISAGISTLALYFGVVLGNRQATIIYHFQDGAYHKVIDLSENSRKIKQKKSEFKEISVDKDMECAESISKSSGSSCDPLLIIIYLASHNPIDQGLKYKEQIKAKGHLIIKSKDNQGNLPIGDWSNIVSEIYTAIDDNKQSENHLIFSAPVPIILALGMALGYFLPIRVHHYARGEYIEVPINLNEELLISPF